MEEMKISLPTILNENEQNLKDEIDNLKIDKDKKDKDIEDLWKELDKLKDKLK